VRVGSLGPEVFGKSAERTTEAGDEFLLAHDRPGGKRPRPDLGAHLFAGRAPETASAILANSTDMSGTFTGLPPAERICAGSSASIPSTMEDAERPIATCAPTNDPAEVPTMRSASAKSTPLSLNPASSPDFYATPTKPPPPKTHSCCNRCISPIQFLWLLEGAFSFRDYVPARDQKSNQVELAAIRGDPAFSRSKLANRFP
jgi:hypothetical protein